MAKSMSCRDVGVDCDFQATGETDEEIMQQVAVHAKTAHGIDEIPAEMAAQVHAAIKEA